MVEPKPFSEPSGNENVFYDNGDEKPCFRPSIGRLALSDTELESLTVTELNQRLQFLDEMDRSALKRKRRALKNRYYARRCRVRRLQIRHDLEVSCQNLMRQYQTAMQKVQYLEQELNRYRQFCSCWANQFASPVQGYKEVSQPSQIFHSGQGTSSNNFQTPPSDQSTVQEVQNDLLKHFEMLDNLDDDWFSC